MTTTKQCFAWLAIVTALPEINNMFWKKVPTMKKLNRFCTTGITKPTWAAKTFCRALLTAMLCAATLSTQAAEFLVTKFADTNNGNGTCNANCSLREAVIAANANPGADTIRLFAGIYRLSLAGSNENTSANGDLDITDDLTVTGMGAGVTVIDGGGIERVIQIGTFNNKGQIVTINGLTIRNGVSADNGGGILNNGKLTLSLVNVEDNRAPGSGVQGGGIYNNDTLTMEGCVLRGNVADDGGAVFTEGGSSTRVDACTIEQNTATASAGAFNNNGTLDIRHSALINNSAVKFNGGAIFNNDTVVVVDSTLSSNAAADKGGAVRNNPGATVTLTNVTLANNSADNGGGGIFNEGMVVLANSLLATNTNGNCGGTLPLSNGHNLEDADDCGLGNDATSLINTDPLLGPLVDNDAVSPTLSHALPLGSPAIDAGDNATCDLNDVFDQRGAQRRRDGNNDGTATCDIGAYEWNPIYTVNSTDDAVDSDPTDDKCETGNGICTLRAAIQQANFYLTAATIVLPQGVYKLSLPGADEDNAATGDLDIRAFITLRGAGAESSIVDANGIDRVFDLRSVGVALTAPLQRPGARLIGVTIRGGSTAQGGGIRSDSSLELHDSVLEGNVSTGSGGGIYTTGAGGLVIVNSTLRNNQSGGIGGAIHHTGSKLAHIRISTLNGNTAGGSGGAMESKFGAVLQNVTVSGNVADSGGGLFLFGFSSLVNSTITGNAAANFEPGGAFIVGKTLIANNIFAGNTNDNGIKNCEHNTNAVISAGFNLEDIDGCGFSTAVDLPNTDPLLGPLADNGGPTLTHALLAGSPAIDVGDSDLCPETDQRGAPRPADGDDNGEARCDSGAYEFASTPPPTGGGGGGGGGGNAASNSGGGCALNPNADMDPIFVLLLIVALGYLLCRSCRTRLSRIRLRAGR